MPIPPLNLNALHLRALTAEEVLAGLLASAKEWPTGNTVSLNIRTNIPNLALDTPAVAKQALATAAEVGSFQKQIAGLRHVSCVRAYLQFDNQSHRRVSYETKDAITAEIDVQIGEPQHASTAVEILSRHFKLTAYSDLVSEISHAIDQQAIQLRERSVADLREELRELAKFMASLTQKEIDTRQKLQGELEVAYQGRLTQLEKDYRERQAGLDAAKAKNDEHLSARETVLKNKASELDLRDSKGVRRQLLTQIEATLQRAETQATSDPTQKKRWWVHGFVWALLILVGTSAGISGYKFFTVTPVDWHYAATFSASMITIVTTLVYYLKWNDRWFREHAEAEFAAKRYKADILRASWVAELTMEFSREGMATNGHQILPQHLLEAFTKNLFVDVGRAEASEHPMDQMTGLLKDATELQVGKTGFKIRKK